MTTMTYAEAIRAGMSQTMRDDDTVFLFGEDVGPFGGCFGVSAGMHDEFGEMRVRDTPISEGVIVGAAVGAAATGVRPIAELMFTDFMTVGMDQLVNQAAKMRYMFGGHLKLPRTARTGRHRLHRLCRPRRPRSRPAHAAKRTGRTHLNTKKSRCKACSGIFLCIVSIGLLRSLPVLCPRFLRRIL
jgi:hypothetical protein